MNSPKISVEAHSRTARFYKTLRSAHLERSNAANDGQLTFYSELSYDLSPEALRNIEGVSRSSAWHLVKELERHNVQVLEVNEPTMVASWKYLIPILYRTRKLRSAGRLDIVSYAIGNVSVDEQIFAKLRRRFPVVPILGDYIARRILAQVDRLAIGTSAAYDLYYKLDPDHVTNVSRQFTALPSRGERGASPVKNPLTLIFVGSLEERKGIRVLMDAWPKTFAQVEGATLRVIGKGPLLEEVREWAHRAAGVTLIVDPPRDVIRAELQSASVLALLSQRIPGWKEQIGLPILEALSQGCTVVTTGETGIASELAEAGHTVLPQGSTVDEVSGAIASALRFPLSPDDVLSQLPRTDGRLEAHDWLMHGCVKP